MPEPKSLDLLKRKEARLKSVLKAERIILSDWERFNTTSTYAGTVRASVMRTEEELAQVSSMISIMEAIQR